MTDLLCVCGVPIDPTLTGYCHRPSGWMGDCKKATPADGSKPARYTYDAEVGATYVYLRHPVVADEAVRSRQLQGAEVHLDYDADGNVLGIEIIAKWPAAVRRCSNCERCTWNPGPDCGKSDHEHCPMCGHCEGRHAAEGET